MCNWPLAYNDKPGVVATYSAALDWAKHGLKVPVLVAFGEDDLILEPTSAYAFFQRWFQASPSVEQMLIPAAGHFPMEQNGGAVAGAIANFMRST